LGHEVPYRCAVATEDGPLFASSGCDAKHTLELPLGNRTPDVGIIEFADRDQRALITKDGDFVDSHLLAGRPAKTVARDHREYQ
jgi:predicted nuclease of predicted toxin-antitoxin system